MATPLARCLGKKELEIADEEPPPNLVLASSPVEESLTVYSNI